MSSKEGTQTFSDIFALGRTVAALIVTLGTIGWAVQKTAIYINLPERLDRFEENQKKDHKKIDKILKIVTQAHPKNNNGNSTTDH